MLSHDSDRLYSIEPATNEARIAGTTGHGTDGIAVGNGAVWVVNYPDNTISRIDPTTGRSTVIPVGHSPAGIGVGYGSVWVSTTQDGSRQTLSRIDPGTNAVIDTVPIGPATSSLATDVGAAAGSIWVTSPTGQDIVRVDPTRVKVRWASSRDQPSGARRRTFCACGVSPSLSTLPCPV